MKEVYKWTDKERALILKTVKEAQEHLGMPCWAVYNRFEDGALVPIDMGNGIAFLESATNTVTPAYQKIDITWKPATLKDLRDTNYEAVRETVYHEMLHGLTEELHTLTRQRFITEDQINNALESLVQHLAVVVCKLIDEKKCTQKLTKRKR